MADPFLLSHSCGPFQFMIAGPLTPVSIRDQMIRGKMAVDRSFEEGLISAQRPLLVVGARAGGATAAIRAAQLGVSVTLIEVGTQAFGGQKRCATRWVDPTQYDWPADHWPLGIFPWTGRQCRFPGQLESPAASRQFGIVSCAALKRGIHTSRFGFGPH